ncbi:MAG: hypothetical protein ABSE82_15920, partial [Nitrososphaerales archaeon]
TLLRYCRTLRRIGILDLQKVEEVNQVSTGYELTYPGKMVALALDAAREGGFGIDRKKLLREVIETMPAASAFHKFSQKMYSVIIEIGRDDVALDMIRKSVETSFKEGVSDPWLGGMFAASELSLQDGFYLKVFQQVFASMTQDELMAVKLFLKYTFQLIVLRELISANKAPAFFKNSIENPDIIFLPFKCTLCGNFEPRRKTKIMELMVATLSHKNVRCKRCRHISPLPEEKKEFPLEKLAGLTPP